MLARSRLTELIRWGEEGKPNGISIVPGPLHITPKQVGGAAVDLRLGRWFLALHQAKLSKLDLREEDPISLEQTHGRYHYVPFEEEFVIHPGRFVLANTLEWVKLPANIGAYITGKSSLGRRGLIIETAAGIHPGFSGCLTLEITNCGEIPIAITPGIRIAQVFFHELTGNTDDDERGRYSGNRKPTFGRYSRDIRFNDVGD